MDTGIIAQANPDPHAFLEFWIIIAFIAGVAVNVVTLIVSLVNRKQKREVSFGFVPTSKEEFEKHQAENKEEHDQIFSKLGGVERGLRGEFTNEIKVIRAEMITASNALAGLTQTAGMLNQAMSAERARLDREIERRREA